MIIDKQEFLVLGLGRSGFSAAKFLAEKGGKVTAIDSAEEDKLKVDLKVLRKLGVQVYTKDNAIRRLEGKNLVVVSPGIATSHPIISGARRVGIPVIGELELAYRFCRAEVIGVTGTNGKSTTTSLIGEILQEASIKCKVAGNIGTPFSAVVAEDVKTVVIELSSYQLEMVETFNPQVAVWLNLTPDHLARHTTMEAYGSAKARIFERQREDETLVYNADDERVAEYAREAPGRKMSFSQWDNAAVYVEDGVMKYDWQGNKGEIIRTEEIRIKGLHNLENSLAAAGAALAYGVKVEAIAAVLRKFPGIEHRQEYVTTINQVTYINDSKATNLDSTLKALETIDAPIILIAGGLGKGESYEPAASLVNEKVKTIIALGQAAQQIIQELSAFTETMYVRTMEDALKEAVKIAEPGDKVLLSPMCASFDMFDDFEHRGRVFKSIVMKMLDGGQWTVDGGR